GLDGLLRIRWWCGLYPDPPLRHPPAERRGLRPPLQRHPERRPLDDSVLRRTRILLRPEHRTLRPGRALQRISPRRDHAAGDLTHRKQRPGSRSTTGSTARRPSREDFFNRPKASAPSSLIPKYIAIQPVVV